MGDYKWQIKRNQRERAQMYGGYAGAYTDENGDSWYQQQVKNDPNFARNSDQKNWSRDAYYSWRDQQDARQLPNVNDLPMPGVTLNGMNYTTTPDGLAVKTPLPIDKGERDNLLSPSLPSTLPSTSTSSSSIAPNPNFRWSGGSVRERQAQKAKVYGGYAGAYTNAEGLSWLQQQVEADPNFTKQKDQSGWQKAARDYWRDPQAHPIQAQPPAGYIPGGSQAVSGAAQPVTPVHFATADMVIKGQAAWTDISVADRKKMLADPKFYKGNQILKFDAATQQEILKDPSFDWKQVPGWQKMYYDFASAPTNIGPVSISGGVKMGAVQGLAMGAGNPGGAFAGALLAVGSELAGYDPNKEAWQQGDGKFTWDIKQLRDMGAGAMGWLQFAADQAEKTIGMGVQTLGAIQDPNVDVADVWTKEGWNAGRGTFEVLAPAMSAALRSDGKFTPEDLLWIIPSVYITERLGKMLLDPEKYKGEELYLGAAMPVELQQTFYERLDEARQRVKNGENYRTVTNELQTGIMGQVGDLVGQSIADPLNQLGKAESKVGEGIAKVTGHDVAAEAFRGTKGLTEAKMKYKNLVQEAKYKTIDPNFKPEKMSWLSKQIAGITTDATGNVVVKAGGFTSAGLLDPIKGEAEARPSLWKDPKGFIKMLSSEDPRSRAQTGLSIFSDNMTAYLNSFEDSRQGVRDAAKGLRALANNDMATWAEMGDRFAGSPEFYTVLPALKEANVKVIDSLLKAMDLTEVNSDYLKTIEDITGDTKGRLIDDLSKRGTAEQDFQRIIEATKASTDPKAKGLLADIESGKFTVDTLKQIVDVFTGEGALPHEPAHWRALIGAEMTDHFQEWAAKRLALDKSPEAQSNFFRMAGIAKTAQSILLLGGSPNYAIQNGLSGLVHLAADGVFGFKDQNFLDRFGVLPSRMDEGVGISGESRGVGAIADAVKGKGMLTTFKQLLSAVNKKMPMSNLSNFFEKKNSQMAFAKAMKSFWSQSWRRDVGFSRMSPALTKVVQEMGINPDHIYAAFEAGMNHADIEKALYGNQKEVMTRSLIHDAAVQNGMSASQAADMLEKVGVLDQLDLYLKGQTTRDGVNAAFAKAGKAAREMIDIRTGEDLARKADHIKQRVGLEGGIAALDVSQQAHMAFTDVWMDHYDRMGNVADLQDIADPKMRAKAYREARLISDGEFARMWANNAANYKGIFDALGLSGNADALKVLQSIGEGAAAMKYPYDLMRELQHDHFTRDWGGDIDAMYANWDTIKAKIDEAMKKGLAEKRAADVKQGVAMRNIYKEKYGAAAGEAVQLWWEDVIKFNDEITAKQREFDQSLIGKDAEARAIAKKEYYSQNKMIQIAELDKINTEGIGRLERVIKNGGGHGGPIDLPKSPEPTIPPEAAAHIAELDKQQQARSQAEAQAMAEARQWKPEDNINAAFEAAQRQDAVKPVRGDAAAVADIAKREAANKQQVNDRAAKLKAELQDLEERARTREQTEIAQKAAQIAAVWDIAEGYWGKGGNYSREVFNDKFALLNVLKDETLGGIKDLSGLDDARVTPELLKNVLDAKAAIKEAEAVKVATHNATFKGAHIGDNTTILKAIADLGGIDRNTARDFTGDPRSTMPGLFTKKGTNIDEIAMRLEEHGYNIDLNHPDDIGGVKQTTELIGRAMAGEKVYPKTHNYDKAIQAAELKRAQMMGEELSATQQATIEKFADPEIAAFDVKKWEASIHKANLNDNFESFYNLVGDMPNEFLDTQVTPDGETYRAFIDRTEADMLQRQDTNTRAESIAAHITSADEAISKQQVRGQAAMTRKLLAEKFVEVFHLDEAKVESYMELSDAFAGWYENATGESADTFYERYYRDAVKGDEGMLNGGAVEALKQAYGRIEGGADRKMTAQDAENYARMLVRGGEGELRSAIRNEPNKADRVAILDAAHKMDAGMAEKVAKGEMDILLQEAYHGSPYKFDKFTLDHMGKGEGEQAYGWGLYFAEDKQVAESYRKKLSKERISNPDKMSSDTFQSGADGNYYKIVRDDNGNFTGEFKRLRPDEATDKGTFISKKEFQNAYQDAEKYYEKNKKGQLYKVEIPDENYLLWDKPLSEQPQAVRDAVKNIQDDYINKADSHRASELVRLYDSKEYTQRTGKEIYEKLVVDFQQGKLEPLQRTASGGFKGNQNASLALKEAGISGIQYLDGSSRSAGEGNYNYVIFDDAAIQVMETFYQMEGGAKGAVTFDMDGMKATIHAFESADMSTLIHENGHVFRRVLADVAERTGNAQIKADLATIEQWAGVKDGVWEVAHEEKFARGFEQYITEGKAPTPALARAFASFKGWMLEIYKTITGSAIDAKISDDVRGVFDRMLGEVAPTRKEFYKNYGLTTAELLRGEHSVIPANAPHISFEFGEWSVYDSFTKKSEQFPSQVKAKEYYDSLYDLHYGNAQSVGAISNDYKNFSVSFHAGDGHGGSVGYATLGDVTVKSDKFVGIEKEKLIRADLVKKIDDLLSIKAKLNGARAEVNGARADVFIDAPSPEQIALLKKYGFSESSGNKYFAVDGEKAHKVIDALKVSDEVRGVFDRMLGEEGSKVESSRSQVEAYRQNLEAIKGAQRIGMMDSDSAYTPRMNDLIREAQSNGDNFPYSKFTPAEQAIVDKAFQDRLAKSYRPQENYKPYVRTITGETVDVKRLSDPAYFVEAYESVFAGSTDEALYKTLTKQLVPSGKEPSSYLADLYNRSKQPQVEPLSVGGLPEPIGKTSSGDNIYAEKVLTSNARGNLDIGGVDKNDRSVTKLMPIANIKKRYKVEVVDVFAYNNGNSGRELAYRVYEEVHNKGQVSAMWKKASNFPVWVAKEGDALVKSLIAGGKPQDTGTVGGMLPGMQDATGMMFDVQSGGGLKRMEAPDAHSLTDVVAGKSHADTRGMIATGDIVKDAKGNSHNIKGVNASGQLVTAEGKLLDPYKVNRVASQSALFQRADMVGEQPFGTVDAAAGDGALLHGEVMDEGWRTQVQPLLDSMREGALRALDEGRKPLGDAVRDMSPEGQKMLRQYMKQVQNEMASSKLSTMRWGEQKRDQSMLNYSKRYGIDRYLELAYPYQFFYTRSLAGWAARALDKPAWFANYARIKQQQQRYENNLPERLRGKIKVSMPWMPEWMGDGLYVDPLALFTPANYLRPFERMQSDTTQQQQEAERILQEWSADGTVNAADLKQAMTSRTGTAYERALAEAKIRRESEISNPLDFMGSMFGPAWYLTTPYKLLGGTDFPGAKGGKETIGGTAILNTTRAIDTVTEGTWAQPFGNAIGMLGSIEAGMRQKLGLPEFTEYGDYYIDRQLANMTAEGVISAEDAQIAMMERKGDTFDQARERVKVEMAMKVPGMSALMAGLTADNFAQGIGRVAATAPASMFGAGMLPEGELQYRGLKQEWNEAWKKADAGDKEAINDFFGEHPEYKAYLMKNKPPEERLRSFLASQVVNEYYSLGATNRKQLRKEFGEIFYQAMIDPETKDPNSVDIATLTNWARALDKKVPNVPETAPTLQTPKPDAPKLYDAQTIAISDKYFQLRKEQFPNFYEVQQGYYNLPKSERTKYLFAHPELKQYWAFNDEWIKAYPNFENIFKGYVFKQLDTSTWNPMLLDYVGQYAMTGQRMPNGAYKALEQQWIMAGKPMGDMRSWLDSQVVPALMYGSQ